MSECGQIGVDGGKDERKEERKKRQEGCEMVPF